MPILEEERKKFFNFLDTWFKNESENIQFSDMKTEGGIQYPKEAFLYVPDSAKPSTWKLRIWETPEKKITRAQLGSAAAAFSAGGFRGNKVDVGGETVSIKAKLVSLYKKDGATKEEIPNYLLEEGDDDMADSKILEDVESRIKALADSFELKGKELEISYNKKFEDTKKELTEAHVKELETAIKRLEEAEKRLSEKDNDLHKNKIEKICDGLVAGGIWPAVVEKAKVLMFADVGNKFGSIKLDDKTEKSVSDIVVEILETIPTDVRISFEDLSHGNKTQDPNKKYLSDTEVEVYAKENKLSYQEACSRLAKEGKIEI